MQNQSRLFAVLLGPAMNEPDLVPLWAAVPKKTIVATLPTPKVELVDSYTPPSTPTQRGRLLLKDEGSLNIIKRWWNTINTDWKELVEALGLLEEHQQTAYFMLMGFVTQDTRHIKLVMPKYSQHWLQSRRERAIKFGIWAGNGNVSAEWLDYAERQDGMAETAFMCDVMTINGDLVKIRQYDSRTRERKTLYKLSKTGLEHANRLSSQRTTNG